jgi:electron transport complex protein RnfC
VKYPQGAEKMLIRALFHQKVPAGGLPLDLDIIVNNVGTMAALADYFDDGLPLIERPVTVSGPGIPSPANLLVPIGTPVREVLRYTGGLTEDTRMVVMGGPMMGAPLADLDGPVLKGTSGLLAFTENEIGVPTEYGACANFLNPTRLAKLGRLIKAHENRNDVLDELEKYFIHDCMECAACSFACPSNIPIVQLIRTGKAALRDRKKQTS